MLGRVFRGYGYMNTCRKALLTITLAVLSQTALGLGLGDITLKSYVNEPFEATIDLLDVGALRPEDIRIRLGTQEDFDRLGVERAYFLTGIQFEILLEEDGARILLTTGEVLVEPYLDFLLEARWPSGRLLREYTVLVDLPPMPSSIATSAPQEAMESTDVVAAAEIPPAGSAGQAGGKRDYDGDAKPTPTAGGNYLVARDDTLWKIAASAALPGVSVEQTMLATVAKNPKAFTRGNINGLKAGYVLSLPTDADLSMTLSEAINAVASQNSDWASGVASQPVLRVVADNDLEADDSSFVDDDPWTSTSTPLGGDEQSQEEAEALTPAANTPAQSNDQGQKAKVAEKEFAAENGAGEEQSEPSTPDVSLGALADIEAQVAESSGQLGNLRELVAIKDKQIAELQASLAAKQASTPAASATFALSSLLYLAGGAAVGALVLFLVLRLRKIPESPEPSPDTVETEPAMAPVPAEEDSQAASEGTKPSGGAIQEALAEAEIYVSFGRHQQALNLLAAVTEKTSGAEAAEAYCKMIEIALANDRLEEAAQWLTQVEAIGTPEQVASATSAVRSVGVTPPDLGELGNGVARFQVDELEMPPTVDPAFDVRTEGDELQPTDVTDATQSAQLLQEPSEFQDLELSELPADHSSDPAAAILSETYEKDVPAKLPPELAAVLGTDVVPPVEEVVESEAETLVYASETDPMDAKLDLARAYIDMGDEEGARPILEDVVVNGDLRQQAEARELLVHIV
jgi:pilus assembly protein FimV